ncbi:WYL domain-containing protein [bacterium]|nr:WYL domain-containing protein [bacterium]
MAGKNGYFRLLAIDKKLQTGRKYNWKMLAELCEIAEGVRERPQKRTIQQDIRDLREKFGAPIPKRCIGGLWYYTDTSFSINNNPLFVPDVTLLQQIKNILDQFPELKFSSSLENLIQKVQNNLEIKPISIPNIIQFEKSKNIIGTDFLEFIYLAILNNQVLKISYQPFQHPKPKNIFVHPYFLKQFNSRWFLVGLEEKKGKLRVYGLERIKKIDISSKKYKLNDLLDPATYFNEVIGVSIPDDMEVQNIKLEISPQRTPYIKTKHLHPSQKVIEELKSGGVIIELKVIPNFELVALILSHGVGIKVLSPPSLIKSVKNEIDELSKFYF